MSDIDAFLTLIIGVVMLWALFRYINNNRRAEGKSDLGCIPIIIISIIVIAFWIFLIYIKGDYR